MKKRRSLFLLVLLMLFSMTLLVSCGDKKYKVTFDVAGGTAISDASVKASKEFTLPTPVKEGYQFDGWYENSSFEGNAVDKIVVNGDVVVYAKWTKLYTVSFELNGGTCASSSCDLVAGANVSQALSTYTVTKGSLTFGGWYLNNEELSSTYVMPEQNITVVAKYLQSYTAEYYAEKEDGTFEKVETVTDKAIVGSQVEADYVMPGYSKVTKEDSVSSITISENASQNVIKEYFGRTAFEVTFDSNNPQGESSQTTATYKTGDVVTFPTDLTLEGYQLVGWSTSKDGEVIYKVNNIDNLVYNEHKAVTIDNDDVKASGEITYYAVWSKGYTDMFNGDDVIYVLDSESGVCYLERAGVFFAGKYDCDINLFKFLDASDLILVTGKLNHSDFTFSYSDLVRASYSYPFYSTSSGLNENITLHLDEYNGVKYADKTNTDVSDGTYSISEDGTLHITYTKGALEDTEMDVRIVSFTNGGNGFMVCNNEDIALGKLYLYQVTNGVLDLNPDVYLELDGYYIANLSGTNCQYKNVDGVITIINSSSSYTVKVCEKDGVKGFAEYNAALDHVYTNGSSTLTIDGMNTATYETIDETVVGYYTLKSAVFTGKALCEIVDDYGNTYQFALSQTSETVDGEAVVSYSFEEVSEDYKECIYVNAEGAYYAPLVVIENETEASVYGFVAAGVFQKISTGTYEEVSEGVYRYTALAYETIPDDVTVLVTFVDLTTVKSFVFGMDEYSGYASTFWYSYTTTEDATTDFTKTYASAKDSELTLEFVAGKFFTKKEGYIGLSGTYTSAAETEDGVETVVYTLTDTNGSSYYIVLDEENKTFTEVLAKVTQYEYVNGKTDQSSYLYRNRAGVLAYYYTVTEGEGEDQVNVNKSVEGKVDATGETTIVGFAIMTFTASDASLSFRYINIPLNNGSYAFAKYDASSDLTFTSNDGASTLVLDGYNLFAILTKDGKETRVMYLINSEDKTISITTSDESYTLDVDFEAKTFGRRGLEAKTYLLVNNSSFTSKFVTLDGYGKATVYKFVDSNKVVIDEEATYTIDYLTLEVELTYTEGSDQHTVTCLVSSYTAGSNSYNALVIGNESLAKKYVVVANYTVVILDEFGNATVYGETGVTSYGSYTMISDQLFYYVEEEGNDATIYAYDNESGTAIKVENEVHGYYSSDFDSLLFTPYGYAVFHNTDRYYYNVVDDVVILYSLDPSNENANEYGFVQKEFGEFDDTVTFDEKQYYVNTGYSIKFNRVAENVEKYKAPLSSDNVQPITAIYFIPRAGEFSVTGMMEIGGKNYSCTVISKLNEENQLVRYAKLGNYVFEIEMTYGGVDSDTSESGSTFDILSMRYELNLPHSNFLSLLQVYAMFGLDYTKVQNVYGGLTVLEVYNEDGTIKESYMNSDFTEKANFVDTKGQLLNFNKSTFTLKSNSSTLSIYGSTVGSDGYTYNFAFETTTITSPVSMMGVKPLYITRTQEFKDDTGFVVTTTQFVMYDGVSSIEKDTTGYVGSLAGISFNNAEGTLENVSYLRDTKGNIYAIVRTYDENEVITSTKYYLLEITESSEASDVAMPYVSCKVTEVSATTYYNSDKTSYVDIVNGEVKSIYVNDEFVSYSSLEYDETTQTYSYNVVTDTETKSYTLKIVEGVLVITEVTQTTEE